MLNGASSRPPRSSPNSTPSIPGGDGADSSFVHTVPAPRLFPQWRNRAALGAIYSLWALLMVGSALSTRKHLSFWSLLEPLVLPMTHLGAFALIAPLPWILWRGRPTFLNFLKGLVLSLVTCETTAVLLVLIDSFILRRAGATFSLWRIIVLYASLVGPGMMLVGGLMAAHARSEDEREAARNEALVAKTRLLQSQVHPHVLFNALNGLAELIHKDPPRAERSVMHLADLMRRIMRASDRPPSPCVRSGRWWRISSPWKPCAWARGYASPGTGIRPWILWNCRPCWCSPWWRTPSSMAFRPA